MVKYRIFFTKRAQKDKILIKRAGLEEKARTILNHLSKDPFYTPPPFEKLCGNLTGFYSRRINIKHRLIYQVFEEEKAIKVIRLWTHYEE